MFQTSFVVGLAISILVTSCARGEPQNGKSELVTIPLERIWAYEMPRTRDVRELEPKLAIGATVDEMARQSDVWKIFKVLGQRLKEGEKAGAAFAVIGKGTDALKNASAVLAAKNEEYPTIAPAQTDLSLVFYSYKCGRYVHLVNVERSPGLVTVQYQFVIHPQQIMSRHFALIPLGKLPEGTVKVQIEQVAPGDKPGRWVPAESDLQRLVSDSFKFSVQRL
jgi:hypothetical protein